MLDLTENARVVLEKRYLLRDGKGEIAETPEALFRRVADWIAQGDLRYEKSQVDVDALADTFFNLMTRLEFLPNSPTLMNAGKPNGQLSACFVLPVEDSLEGIFETLKHAALIHQSGGGTGFSFTRLRPRGDFLSYTSGTTSGPVSFMEVYNAATEAIKQGGTRRGANMGILRIDHPDIEEFIAVKNDLSRLTNFNISVAVTDAFMQAVTDDKPFDLIHPKLGTVAKTLPARQLMRQIVDCAWQTGEPGIVFIDRVNDMNVTPGMGPMEATNPCGEVPLLPYEACNLGSINLGRFVMANTDDTFGIDWARFAEAIRLSVHFLENVIVQNCYPLPEIRSMVDGNRKIGLGLMGWADALMQLSIPYDCEEAIALAEDVMAFMEYHSKQHSALIAAERGRFPFFSKSVYTQPDWFSQKYADAKTGRISAAEWKQLDERVSRDGLRHATTLCLAPTGTISIIANASGGIEPLFALAFVRTVLDNTRLLEANALFKSKLQQSGIYSDDLIAEVSANHGSVRGVNSIPETMQQVFVTAYDVTPSWHVRMQAAFQRYSDNAVSKTINFPQSATPQQIEESYQLAYRLELKGITVYRDNSRKLQPMQLDNADSKVPMAVDAQHCPDCRQPLEIIEGCRQCPTCHYAYCG